MNHCEMVWTTAGTNRVCGRCLELKDTVVGHTNEVGVQLPPLHPRCRCTISYRELTSKPTGGNVQPNSSTVSPLTAPATSGNVGGGSKPAGFIFDLQRFGTYEDQVASHGGSGNIKPDKIVAGHDRTPCKTEPLSIIDHKDYRELVDKRIFYDENGRPYFEINTTNHGNPKNHPFGEHGEHAHDIEWSNGKANRATRELTPQERKDNGDIL